MFSFEKWFIILKKFLQNDTELFYELKIIGDSMFPTFIEGEIVRVKYKKIDDIDIGDILVFSHSFTNFTIHRVIEKKILNGNITFVTKGDNNSFEDNYFINDDKILGVVNVNE